MIRGAGLHAQAATLLVRALHARTAGLEGRRSSKTAGFKARHPRGILKERRARIQPRTVSEWSALGWAQSLLHPRHRQTQRCGRRPWRLAWLVIHEESTSASSSSSRVPYSAAGRSTALPA